MKPLCARFAAIIFVVFFIYYCAKLILPQKWMHRQTTTYTIIPPISIAGQVFDAELGSEFSLLLTSNVNLGIIHMVDGRAVNLAVTNVEHTLIFTNQISWLPTNTIPYAASNDITLFCFMQNSNIIYGSVMRWNKIAATNIVEEYHFDFREPIDSATNHLTN